MNDTRLKIPIPGFGNFDANDEYEMIIWSWEQSLKKTNEVARLRHYTYVLLHFEKRMEECNAFELLTFLRKQISRKQENQIRKSINEQNKKLHENYISQKEARLAQKKRYEISMRKLEVIGFDNLKPEGHNKMMRALRKQIKNN